MVLRALRAQVPRPARVPRSEVAARLLRLAPPPRPARAAVSRAREPWPARLALSSPRAAVLAVPVALVVALPVVQAARAAPLGRAAPQAVVRPVLAGAHASPRQAKR